MAYWKPAYGFIKRELAAIDWDTEFNNLNVTESWQVSQKKISLLCDKYVPLKKNNATSKQKNHWITKATIKELRNERRRGSTIKQTESNSHYKTYKAFKTWSQN